MHVAYDAYLTKLWSNAEMVVIPARPTTKFGMLRSILGPGTIETICAKFGACHFCTPKSVFSVRRNGGHTYPAHHKIWYAMVDLRSGQYMETLCKIWCMLKMTPKMCILSPVLKAPVGWSTMSGAAYRKKLHPCTTSELLDHSNLMLKMGSIKPSSALVLLCTVT